MCIKKGITKQEGIKIAVTKYVENFEHGEKLMQGCGEKHTCYSCKADFDCFEFCGQTFYHECKKCMFHKAEGKLE